MRANIGAVNDAAVLRAWKEAMADGRDADAERIRRANPDLFCPEVTDEEFFGGASESPRPPYQSAYKER